MKKEVSVLFMLAGILFATCLLISNILATKILMIGSWAAPAGVLIFPIAYILNDVITEVWGFKKARLIIWTGFAVNILAVLFFTAGIVIPRSPFLAKSGSICNRFGQHTTNCCSQFERLPNWIVPECFCNEPYESVDQRQRFLRKGNFVDTSRRKRRFVDFHQHRICRSFPNRRTCHHDFYSGYAENRLRNPDFTSHYWSS